METLKLWIARDKDGMLHLFRAKPKKFSTGFGGYNKLYIDPDKFPEVTFENSPQEVELKLIEK